MIVIFFLFLSFFSYGQQYPLITLNALEEDTFILSRCQFPYHIDYKPAQPNQTINWEVVEGEAEIGNTTSSKLYLFSMLPDTCTVRYTRYDSQLNEIEVYHVTFLLSKGGCGIINTQIGPNEISCNTTFNLSSRLQQGYTYYWYTDRPNDLEVTGHTTANPGFKPKASGAYKIIVEASTQLFSVRDTFQFSVNCPTIANAGPDQVINACQFPFQITGNAPAQGETVKWEVIGGNATLVNSNSRTVNILDAKPGTVLRYTIINGNQQSSDDVIINVVQNYPFCDPYISKTSVVCGESFTIAFNFSSPGVYSNYNFYFNIPPGITSNNPPFLYTQTLTANAPGTYFITVNASTYSGFNTWSKSFFVNVSCSNNNTVTQANAGPDRQLTICSFPITLAGNSPASDETVSWTVASGQAIIQNPNSPGATIVDAANNTYLVYTITKGNQISRDTMRITVNPQLPASCLPTILPPNRRCGDTLSIVFNFGTSAPYTFNWDLTGLTVHEAPTHKALFSAYNSGTYPVEVTITSPGGYNTTKYTTSFTFNCPAPITIPNAGQDATAYCSSFTLNANSPAAGETGTWSMFSGSGYVEQVNNPNSKLIFNAPGTFGLVWTISNGTTSLSDTVMIFANPLRVGFPNIKHASCNKNDGRAQVAATGGLPPYTYKWQNGSTTATIFNIPAGIYSVTVTDQTGCTVTDSVRIEDGCVGNELYILQGHVKAGANMLGYGLAILMKDINGLPIPVKTAKVVNGFYQFTGVEKGDYLVYILPYKEKEHINLHDQFLPTFYVNKVSIFFANPVYVIGNTYGVDITLVEKRTADYGPYHLGVNINAPKDTLISMLPVLLFNDQNELVASAFSNGSQVSFDNLASGKYYMSVPVQGAGYADSQEIEILSGNKETTIGIDNGKITGTESVLMNSLKVYPNPFKDNIMVEGMTDGNFSLCIAETATGRILKSVNASEGINNIDTSELPSGYYIIQLKYNDAVENIPMIKY